MISEKNYFIKLAGVMFGIVFMLTSVAYAEDTSLLLERIKKLERSLEDVKFELQRTKDVDAIRNIIVKQAYLAEAGMDEERFEYFAKKTPGIAVERSGRGVYEGVDGAYKSMVITEKFFQNLHAQGMRMTYPDHEFTSEMDGYLQAELVASPVIEVAGDGKTAKAVWIEIMLVTKMYAEVTPPEDMQKIWFWSKVGADFVKEDGEWKIWHYAMGHFIGGDNNGLRTPRPIVEQGNKNAAGATVGEENKFRSSPAGGEGKGHGSGPADRGSSEVYQMGYSLDKAPGWFPKPPESYESFNDEDAYVYPSIPGEKHKIDYNEKEIERWSDPDAVKKWKEQGFDFK